MADLTPMVKQYQQIKAAYQDAILFFRLGDFYEMFNEDAELASRLLDLTLTGRGKDDNRMPMCGLPFHAADSYIAKLIELGHKVAICEQVEDPQLATGVVKREVVRLITPGTVVESSMLSDRTSNYLIAVNQEKKTFGLAVIEATTGEFRLTDLANLTEVVDEIKRIQPAEILVADLLPEETTTTLKVLGHTTFFKDTCDPAEAAEKLTEYFGLRSLGSFGLTGHEASLGGAVAIINYLQQTQKSTLGHINKLRYYQTKDFMYIDQTTRRNLELTQTVRDKKLEGSLLWVLDKSKSAMGSRCLRDWLLQPLLDITMIEQRQDAVSWLLQDGLICVELGEELKKISDIARLTGKVATQTAKARDLVALKESLGRLPRIKALLATTTSSLLGGVKQISDGAAIVELIAKTLVDDPPMAIKEGGIIKPGFNQELDELKHLTRGGKEWIAELEAAERKRTGIKSLKVGYTKVFGYYLEVTNSNLEQVPPDYIRKQTLVNAERFITPELKEKESQILNADQRVKELEYQFFCELRSKTMQHVKELQAIAEQLAQTDVLLALAEVAKENHYCRPEIVEENCLNITAGRHPVVEKTLGEFHFVPNDLELDDETSFLLITGPNMGGKSTYMRQAALIAILAQIGSFVPAKKARVGLVDRIFTRIGAMDDIYAGQSTFMVEMTETANILNNATERSLIILDEIGRGTSTFDGMSIAAAVAEFICTRLKAKTLFATHYHEITQLADKHPEMKNLHLLVTEAGDQIEFLHKVAAGSADRSYGIQVAKLAGLPPEVVKRAKEIFNTLEMVESDLSKSQKKTSSRPSQRKTVHENQAGLF